VDRLIESQPAQHALAEGNLAVMRGQQRDFEARLGAAFPHNAYLAELTELRDRLEVALSFDPKKSSGEPPNTAEIVASIKALRAGHAVEDAPDRTAKQRAATIEESVTARIRRAREEITEPIEDGDITAAWAEAARETTVPLLVIRPDAPSRAPRVPPRQLAMFGG
jgi:hypothetical protein